MRRPRVEMAGRRALQQRLRGVDAEAAGRVPFTGAGVRRMVILATGLVLAGLLLLSGREVMARQRAAVAASATARWMSATKALRR